MNTSHSFDSHDLQLTGSIGLSTYPEDGQDAEKLLKNADAAMYESKKRGRNNYQFFKPDTCKRQNRRAPIVGG